MGKIVEMRLKLKTVQVSFPQYAGTLRRNLCYSFSAIATQYFDGKITLCILCEVKLQWRVSAAEPLCCLAPTKKLVSRVSTKKRQRHARAILSVIARAVRLNRYVRLQPTRSQFFTMLDKKITQWNNCFPVFRGNRPILLRFHVFLFRV